jgi:hypothetical protein
MFIIKNMAFAESLRLLSANIIQNISIINNVDIHIIVIANLLNWLQVLSMAVLYHHILQMHSLSEMILQTNYLINTRLSRKRISSINCQNQDKA